MNAPDTLLLPSACRRRMVRHARRDAPRECCGFLIGDGRRVTSIVEVANVSPGLTRYRVDPREHIALRRALRQDPRGVAIVGVYHSHPAGPAAPSETDIAEAHYPDWVHVIVGLEGARARVRAFGLARGQSWAIAIREPAGAGAARRGG